MANFLIQAGVLTDYILTRFSPTLFFVRSTGDGDNTNEQFQFCRLSTSQTGTEGYALVGAASGGTAVANTDGYGMGGERPISETTVPNGELYPFALQSNGQAFDGGIAMRLLVGFGTPTGPATTPTDPGYGFEVLNPPPDIPYNQGFLTLLPVGNAQAPQVTATGQGGNIAISGKQLPPGQYGVTYVGLRNVVDLYTTQILQGQHYFGLEPVGADGVLSPILDQVQVQLDDPTRNITVILERVVDTQLPGGRQIDRIVEAITMLPASAFKQ